MLILLPLSIRSEIRPKRMFCDSFSIDFDLNSSMIIRIYFGLQAASSDYDRSIFAILRMA